MGIDLIAPPRRKMKTRDELPHIRIVSHCGRQWIPLRGIEMNRDQDDGYDYDQMWKRPRLFPKPIRFGAKVSLRYRLYKKLLNCKLIGLFMPQPDGSWIEAILDGATLFGTEIYENAVDCRGSHRSWPVRRKPVEVTVRFELCPHRSNMRFVMVAI